jgi:PAS domain S-box-containing protein
MNVVLNSSSTAMLLENENRQIEFVNQAFCDLFNIPAKPEEMLGADCSQAAEYNKVLFIDEQSFVDNINSILLNKEKVENELLFMKNFKVLQRDYIPIYKKDIYVGHMWSYKDITETFSLNKKIEQQKQFYEDILNSLPVDVAVFNEKHQYLFVNEVAIADKNVRDWLVGKDDYDYVNNRNKPLASAHFRRDLFQKTIAAENPEDFDYEEAHDRKDGTKQYILRKMKPVFNPDGSIKIVVGCGVDITNRVHSEEKLQLSEAKYKDLVNNLQDIIFNVDLDGYFTYLNPAWETITGLDSVGFIGKNYSQYFVNTTIDKTIAFNDLINNNNSIRDQEYSIKTIYGLKNVSVYRGTVTDITERKKAEHQLVLAMQRERELNDLKSKFVGMVSHEFRTPLATISSSVELIKLISENTELELSSKIQKHTSKVNEQIKRMTELMNEVLLISKIESGGITANFELYDLLLILNEVKAEHSYSNFKINIKSNQKNIMMRFDRNMIHHVLSNLFSNAIKYSLTIKTIDINIELNDTHVRIEVKDYGIGIPDEDLEKLFTSFFRASNIRNLPGTGLGLVVVKYFLDLHKGYIDVASKLNEGSSFIISIPTTL